MSTSTANVTPTNIPLSPMRVTFNGVDLGGTTNEVNMSIKYEMADIMVDQFGKSVIDKVVSGLAYSIKFVLAEVKYKPNWIVAFPSMHLVNGSSTAIYSDMQVGDHLYPKAKQLLLHPLENANSDLTEDYLFYKAIATQVSEVKYGPEKQTGLSVEMIVFPDIGVSPARYMLHGDPANVIVNAVAAAAVAGGGNVGNGTVGSEAVTNGYTKTETITILCVGQTSGNNFYVSGSVSGPLGEFHIAAASTSTASFSTNQIAFVLTQGSVQFANGDSFTIATTASNFV